MYLMTLSDIKDYLNVHQDTILEDGLQGLYSKSYISYPFTQDRAINKNDLADLQHLLNIQSTPVETHKDSGTIFGPLRPVNFIKDNSQVTQLEVFLHALITDNMIAWLTGHNLDDLRDHEVDKETYGQIVTVIQPTVK